MDKSLTLAQLRQECSTSFSMFVEFSARHILGVPPPKFHYYMADFMQGTRPEWRNTIKTVLGFRLSAKTYLCGRQYLGWRWLRNPYLQVKIESSSDSLAEDMVKALLKSLRDNPLTEHLAPVGKHSERSFNLNGVAPEQGKSISCSGVDTRVTSGRADIYLYDDPEPNDHPEGMREDILASFTEADNIRHTPERHLQYWKKNGFDTVPMEERTQIIVLGQPHWTGTAYLPNEIEEDPNSMEVHPLEYCSRLIIPICNKDETIWTWPEMMKTKYYDQAEDRPMTVQEVKRRTPTEVWQCFLPSCKVAGEISVASEGWYDGPAVEIVTELGVSFLTGNHPVMTTDGWVSAKDIKSGQELVCCSPEECGLIGLGERKTNVDDIHTSAEDLFSRFSTSGVIHTTKTVSDADFHGDGKFMNKDVNAFSIQKSLSRTLVSSIPDNLDEVGFPSSHSAVNKSSLLEPPVHATQTHPRDIGNIFGTESILEHLDMITVEKAPLTVSIVRHFDYSGVVYNFETTTGIISSAGTMSKNCQQKINPRFDEFAGQVLNIKFINEGFKLPERIYTAIDPADGENCEWGVVLGGISGGTIHLVIMTGFMGECYDWVDEDGLPVASGESTWCDIFDLMDDWRSDDMLLEVNWKAAQTSCRRFMRRYDRKKRIIEHRAKHNKLRRICNTLEPIVNNSMLSADPGIIRDPKNRKQLTQLRFDKLPQMCDRLDALQRLVDYLIETQEWKLTAGKKAIEVYRFSDYTSEENLSPAVQRRISGTSRGSSTRVEPRNR